MKVGDLVRVVYPDSEFTGQLGVVDSMSMPTHRVLVKMIGCGSITIWYPDSLELEIADV